MNSFATNLVQTLASKHLLKHPFYQAWTAGKLSQEDLQTYSKQYFHHVDAFPRYISATHSNCTDLKSRQILLENLADEENGDRNHPELWLRFAEGLDVNREEVKNAELLPETQKLIDTFFECARSSYAEGVGALFAYEHQIPEVAQTKIDGLKKHFNISDQRTLDFFETHLKADVWHTEQTSELMDSMSAADQEKAKKAAMKLSAALWSFLDGVQRETCGDIECA